jgi:tetratricopeptide (TPR) repeat protein
MLWRSLGTMLGQGTALRRLAVSRLRRGDLPAAADACAQARAQFTSLNDATSVAHVLSTEGDIARERGDDAAAAALYQQAMDGFRSIGDRRCIASTYKNLAVVATRRDEHDDAWRLFREAVLVRHDLGDVAGLAECLEGLAECSISRGDAAAAATLLGMAGVVRRTTGAGRDPSDLEAVNRTERAARTALGAEAFDSAVTAVAQLSPTAMVVRVSELRIEAGSSS